MTHLSLISGGHKPLSINSSKMSRPKPVSGVMMAKGLTDSTVQELYKRFGKPISEVEYRNRALLFVLTTTGLRAREIVSLRFSRRILTPDGLSGFRYIRKGGVEMVTIPSADSIEAVKAYHAKFEILSDSFFLSTPTNARRQRGPITTRTLQRIIDSWKIFRADGIKASPHSFRHTVGQKVFLKAGSLAAQKVLGHSSPVITSKFYTLPYYDATGILEWNVIGGKFC